MEGPDTSQVNFRSEHGMGQRNEGGTQRVATTRYYISITKASSQNRSFAPLQATARTASVPIRPVNSLERTTHGIGLVLKLESCGWYC